MPSSAIQNREVNDLKGCEAFGTNTDALSLFPTETVTAGASSTNNDGAEIQSALIHERRSSVEMAIDLHPDDTLSKNTDHRLRLVTVSLEELTHRVRTFECWQQTVDAEVARLRQASLERERQTATDRDRGVMPNNSQELPNHPTPFEAVASSDGADRQHRTQRVAKKMASWRFGTDHGQPLALVMKPLKWGVHHRRRAVVGTAALALLSGFIVAHSGRRVRAVDQNRVTQSAGVVGRAPIAAPPAIMPKVTGSVPAAENITIKPVAPQGGRGQTPGRFEGTLTIQSEPHEASVFLNQRFVGRTPVQLRRLRAGSYALWVECEGYQRWTAAVLVPAEKITRVSVELKPSARP
jgi:hypothetical protein